jgi:CHASE2 domain-containing sensor protein
MQAPVRGRVVRALGLGIAVSLGVTAISHVGLLAGWETRAMDAFQFLRDRQSSPDVVLVTIDEETFRELGERQPLSRRFLADLADLLLRSGARVVALDVQLRVPTVPDADAALLAVARRWREGPGGRLVLATEVVPAGGAPSDGGRHRITFSCRSSRRRKAWWASPTLLSPATA